MKKLKQLLAILSIFFLVSACSHESKSKYQLAHDEHTWLTQFFTKLLLDEHGIYTLWGSLKPVTLAIVENYSDEEINEWYNALTEEDKKVCCITEPLDFKENWEKWEKIKNRFQIKKYLLFKHCCLDNPKIEYVYFIDVHKTANIIRENYDIFRQILGYDFHPLELVLEMQNNPDILNKLNSLHCGILFGYGKLNSQMFHWKHYEHTPMCDEFCKKISTYFSSEPKQGYLSMSLDSLEIPSFISFDSCDPLIEDYEREREKIKEVYKGQDFLELTLDKLTDNVALDRYIEH